MESYIVRILRRSTDNPEEIIGFVEKPEFEVKKAFKNSEELVNIFVAPDLPTNSNKQKQVIEKRRFRRFLMKEGTVIFDSTTDIGEIKDISMGGLSFVSSNMISDYPETTEIGILCGDDKNILRNIKCKRINHHSLPDNLTPDHPAKGRRLSLEFVALSSQQKSQLENIIQDCTLLEA